MKTMIEVEHISKKFVSNKKYPGLKGAIKSLVSSEKETKTAVDDISFTIGEGEIVGYIGRNGAGKSTTIKMMTGILTPTKGTCRINGIDQADSEKKMLQTLVLYLDREHSFGGICRLANRSQY